MFRRRFRTVCFAALVVGSVASLALMSPAGPPALKVEHAPRGIVSLQLAWNEDEAQKILGEWDDAGVTGAAVTSLAWDCLLILVYGFTCIAGVVLACSAYPVRGRRWLLTVALGAVVATMLFDAAEDVGLSRMLAAGRDGPLGGFPLRTSLCATGKFVLLAAVGLFVLSGPIVALWSWLRSAPPGKPSNTEFRHVLYHEMGAVETRRGGTPAGGAAGTLEAERHGALEKGLVGLAFSGGGIRSGTFSLGFLQGLARLRLLRLVDYLSTVSGGGYAGAWLAAWVYREGLPVGVTAPAAASPLANVEKQLDPSRVSQSEAARVGVNAGEVRDAEPEPIRHLRAYSDYLASRPGLFSVETWALGAIYLRNTFVNQVILGAAAMVFVLMGHLLLWCFDQGGEASEVGIEYTGGTTVLFLLAGFLAAVVIAWSKARSFLASQRPAGTSSQPSELSLKWFRLLITLPLVAAAVAGCWAFTIDPVQAKRLHDAQVLRGATGFAPGGPPVGATLLLALLRPSYTEPTEGGRRPDLTWDIPPRGVTADATTLRHGWYASTNAWLEARGVREAGWKFVWLFAVAAAACAIGAVVVHWSASGFARVWMPVCSALFLVTAVGALVYLALAAALWPLALYPAAVLTLGPPLLLMAFAFAGATETAVFSRWMTPYEREWRSRLGATLAMIGAGWLAFFAAILYLPWAIAWANGLLWDWATPAAIAGWAVTTLGGVLAGKSRRTGEGASRPSPWLEWVAILGPIVFLVGLLALLSVLARYLVPGSAHVWHGGAVAIGGDWKSFCQMAVGALTCLVAALLLSSFTDINVFSMHALYANRLVRCYLGASRHKNDPRGTSPGSGGSARRDNPVTGFDPGDDIPLSDLRYAGANLNYRGPYPLFNTALNLVGGDDLATRDRKAASFVLTPDYCGSDPTQYAPTPRGGDDKRNITLGRAMAISGAAVDPNMSFHQSPQVTALLTVFNARLGWWLQNPGRSGGQPWAASAPLGGMLWQLAREFLGLTDEKGDYVHLSDGGHYDNSGVYELIRRRCRYVVALDVGTDHPDASETLANLIRLVRSDFGIRIEIETAPIRKDASGLSRWHVAVGSIRYDDVDDRAVAGTLVFLRASLTGDEPPDVRQYAIAHPDFPHTTTLNQFFDEALFESYRALGEHIAKTVFEGPVEDSSFDDDGLTAQGHAGAARRLFGAVRNRWFPPPPAFDENYRAAGQSCASLLAKVRTDPRLRGYADALYPEFASATEDRTRAELLAVNETLDVMEEAWMGIRLGDFHSHPMHRGWMDALRRWSASGTFQRFWPVLRGEYSKDFVRFCERTLSLSPLLAVPERLAAAGAEQPALDRLNAEFLLEWGSELAAIQERTHGRAAYHFRDINEAAAQAGADAGSGRPMVWLLRLARRVPGKAGEAPRVEVIPELRGHPVGVLVVSSFFTGPVPHEVLFWIRGAYRSQGLGRSSVEYAEVPNGPLLHESIRAELRAAKVPEVIARYPECGTGEAVQLERSLWMTFFHDYAFHRDRSDRGGDFLTLRYTP
jgi:hypothetical protein